jgi:hypothetical protein
VLGRCYRYRVGVERDLGDEAAPTAFHELRRRRRDDDLGCRVGP